MGVALDPRASTGLDAVAVVTTAAASISLADLWRGRIRHCRRCPTSSALDRGAPLVGIVAALWALRRGSGALGRFERTASYAWLVWWLAAALQWARADDAVGGGLKPELAADGVVIVGLGAVLRLVRNEWPRPHPALVAADEIHAALNGTLLARRVNRVVGTVGFAALIWAFTQSL